MDINQLFEDLYVKNAPSWSLERDPDGSYKYHATQSAFLLFEKQQIEIESLKTKSQVAHGSSELMGRIQKANMKWLSITSLVTTTDFGLPDAFYIKLDELHNALNGIQYEAQEQDDV